MGRQWLFAFFISALTTVAGGIAMSQVTLIENGKSNYRIVVPANAIPSESYAAEELQRYLERIGNVKLPIVTDSEPMTEHEILLGDNAHLRKLRLRVDFTKLGTDGFVLRTHRNYLIIAGGRPRGTLYGVYALLEEKLGVRWFTPEVEFVPKMERVELPALNETQVPELEYREVFWTEMLRDADFAARHRLNGHHYRLTEKHGGRAVVFYPFVHSFD
ncbi:MAG: alpha-glucuronidase family glycosyl hydrolase, partial [Armatimonadota bacterium]